MTTEKPQTPSEVEKKLLNVIEWLRRLPIANAVDAVNHGTINEELQACLKLVRNQETPAKKSNEGLSDEIIKLSKAKFLLITELNQNDSCDCGADFDDGSGPVTCYIHEALGHVAAVLLTLTSEPKEQP